MALGGGKIRMAKKGQTVTRYSHNPLAKKFKCPECDNWFRTLQGLSGHIRFRHGVYEKEEDIVAKLMEVEEKKLLVAAWCKGAGVSRETLQTRVRVLDRWAQLLTYCSSFGVRLGVEDFKNYVIDSFGRGLGVRE
jgi:uncharacterized C2H2 Zn-finger protein